MLLGKGNEQKEITIVLGQKFEKSFTITKMENADALQKDIYKSWMKE